MAKYDENIELMINKMGISKDEIPDFIFDYIVRIEQLATDIEVNQNEAIEQFKKNKFNPTFVSKQINCSRTTLYNNEILNQYIGNRETELSKNNPYNKINELSDALDEMRKEIDMLEKRDVELELLTIENEELAKELRTSKVDTDNLKTEIAKRDKEIRAFRKKALTLK